MDYILEFYNGLDTINLIIFWGVIIVILLLLFFSIIMVNKNRRLERIIEAKGVDLDGSNDYDDLAIKKTSEVPIVVEKTNLPEEKKDVVREIPVNNSITIENHIEKEAPIVINTPDIPIKEEKFVAEEHVMEYNQDFFEIPTLKKQNDNREITIETPHQTVGPKETKVEKPIVSDVPKTAYQKNILKEVYPTQTSPIGTVKQAIKIDNKPEKTEGIASILTSEKTLNVEVTNNITVPRKVTNDTQIAKDSTRYQTSVYSDNYKKGNYLEELSKKMSQSNIDRTSYELKQEEDAIISYQELMQKKDRIHIIDEEDAVISIEELKQRKLEEDKLYNLTEKEPNDDFINELKNFRSDL